MHRKRRNAGNGGAGGVLGLIFRPFPPLTATLRRPRESGDPEQRAGLWVHLWIPACAGMTESCGRPAKTGKNQPPNDKAAAPLGPLRRQASSKAGESGEVGEDCLRGAAPSAAAARPDKARRAAGAARRRTGGTFFFDCFLLGEASRKQDARQARNPVPQAAKTQKTVVPA